MRARLASVACGLFLAGCLDLGAVPADVNPSTQAPLPPSGKPSWTDGDHWVQRAYYNDKPEETLAVYDYYVQGTTSLETGGSSYNTLKVIVQEGNLSFWLTVPDVRLAREANGTQARDYAPPCDAYPATLAAQASWTHECRRLGTMIPNPASTDALTSLVEAQGNVEVPAGTFQAWRIRTTGEGASYTEFYAPGACFPAKVVVEGNRTIVLDLVAYECRATSGGR